jgi:outer membrane receptor protein involved in Fe transport
VLFSGAPVSFQTDQDFTTRFDRESLYLYDQWQVWPTLLLSGGVSYDRVRYPENHRFAPFSDEQETRDQVSPKAGLVFTPGWEATIRAAYFRALGGVSLDQSYRIEPSQVAGFTQAYRSLIPEAVVGASPVPEFEAWHLSLEKKFGRGTYLAAAGEILSSDVKRSEGAVDFVFPAGAAPLQLRDDLNYRERSLALTFNQLLGADWAFGARYRVSYAELDRTLPQIPSGAALLGGAQPEFEVSAVLQQLHLDLRYNHPSGFFAGAGAVWTEQRNFDYEPDIPGDDFWQFNIEAGWRFFRRRLEARVALLNITDQDYKLNPLNLTPEMPRDRMLATSLRFHF